MTAPDALLRKWPCHAVICKIICFTFKASFVPHEGARTLAMFDLAFI